MTLRVERGQLVAALSTAVKAVEKRSTHPILGNVLLTVGAGRLTVRGTDLDIEITTSIPADGEMASTTVSAAKLLEIARKFPAGSEATLDLDGENLIVKSGRSRFKLAVLSADSFPELKAKDFGPAFEVDLAALFAPVQFAISNEETRYYLNGIFLHNPGSALRAVATDGHRMAQHDAATVGDIPAVIVPKKTVALVPPGVVQVELSDTKIRITKGETVIVSKLIEGTFPDYQRVTPKNNDNHLTANRADLLAALDRVGTIANERGGKAVRVDYAGDNVLLTVTGGDGESATEDVAAHYSEAEFSIGFNTAYLAEALRTATGENIVVSVLDANSPALIKGGNDNWQSVLMPMRVA